MSEEDIDGDDELDEEEMGEELVHINLDNIHPMVEFLFGESKEAITLEAIYKFLLTPEIWDVEMPVKEFTEKYNGFVLSVVNEGLWEMARDGELDVFYDEKEQDFSFYPAEKKKEKE